MVHITLSIPDDVYKEMKRHPEIKWSEIARQGIVQKTLMLKKGIPASEFLKLVSPEARKSITETAEKQSVIFSERMRKAAWKRARYLTQA